MKRSTLELTRARNSGWDRESLISIVLAVFLITLAFASGYRATSDLTWGPYVDFDRDASFAQSILDGHYGEDPLYRDEVMWFTPLLFSMQAFIVKATGVSIQVFQAQAGAFLNLLGPIAFFLMVWRLFNPSVALVALWAQLYLLPGQEPGWAIATYSPWFLPMMFSQGLFYLMVIALHRSFRSSSWLVWLGVGTGAGVLFLAHAAPAMILVGTVAFHLIYAMVTAWRAGDRPAVLAHLKCSLASGAAFIIITLPLTWYVVGHYGLDQVNRIPTAFTYTPLSLRNWKLFLFHNASLFNLIAVIGVVGLFRGKGQVSRVLMRSWILLALFFGFFGYMAVTLGVHYGIKLPTAVPTFHFYFYLKAALAIGFAHIMVLTVERGWRYLGGTHDLHRVTTRTTFTLGALILLQTAIGYPAYANRSDLILTRQQCLERMADTGATDMCYFMRVQLPWEAVVLCDDELSMWVLMASARKTVATNASMANPYVLPAPRELARAGMLAGLKSPAPEMDSLLQAYDVSYLLIRTSEAEQFPERGRWFPHLVHRSEGYLLYSRE
ncbi:MAG: hypothetical protein K8H89_05345 [Flavobacteriales bacterium]|jgi:hypothetical protein|nr:hypothetical protein [Flavobacteriales bacterium]